MGINTSHILFPAPLQGLFLLLCHTPRVETRGWIPGVPTGLDSDKDRRWSSELEWFIRFFTSHNIHYVK